MPPSGMGVLKGCKDKFERDYFRRYEISNPNFNLD
jgi:hypothetical protein